MFNPKCIGMELCFANLANLGGEDCVPHDPPLSLAPKQALQLTMSVYGRRYNTRIYLFRCVLNTRMEVQIHTGRSAGRDQARQVTDADDNEEETSNANRTYSRLLLLRGNKPRFHSQQHRATAKIFRVWKGSKLHTASKPINVL